MSGLEIAVATYVAYLFGSLSTAIIVCKIMGLPDPRTLGSQNPGATNVLRIGGKKAAIITLLGDMLKGAIPVFIAMQYGFSPLVLTLIAFAAFLGHLFPIFFRFEGGKGVATALGGLLVLCWPAGLFLVGLWIVIASLFKYSSLASLCLAIMAPVAIGFFTENIHQVSIIAIMSLFLVFTHRRNIANLIQGNERKLFTKDR